jgi:hypothetical protein
VISEWFIRDLFAADQLGLSASVWWSYCNITESAIRRQSSHERFVVGDGRFRIPNTFNISIAAPMPERPASAKFNILPTYSCSQVS